MKHLYSYLILLFLISPLLQAQSNVNGTFDSFEDFSTITKMPFTMPDGVELMTDVYLPITSDSLVLPLELEGIGEISLELIPKGIQWVVYDSIENEPNPNPFQLPFIFLRTPYDKDTEEGGFVANILGYGFAIQDLRGRYESEGVYFPMYSDGWEKNAYHPEYSHAADVTDLSSPFNGNKHEDGYNSVQYLVNDLTGSFDLDGDGTAETTAPFCNGSVGMLGGSALGNTQYQAAAARKINPNEKGLKCLVPAVATNEHFNSTAYNNGVLRESLVRGWLYGQIVDLEDEFIDIDDDLQNDIHTAADYNLQNKNQVAELCVEYSSEYQFEGNVASAYPNSIMRSDFDASRAPVDSEGLSNANGLYSRYSNMEVPMYHLSGWWDIFVSGQIDTYNRLMNNLSEEGGNKKFQKIVIGPYAHQTLGSRTTGDQIYKENVNDVLNADFSNISIDNVDVEGLLQSEVALWYRQHLNYRQGLGEPKVRIPESQRWQETSLGEVRVPSEDYYVGLMDMLNFLSGKAELPAIKLEINSPLGLIPLEFPIPQLTEPLLEIPGEALSPIAERDFSDVPNFRFYVPGPLNDGIAANENVGNYWFSSDVFPLTRTEGVEYEEFYLHENQSINAEMPSENEGILFYTHDPNNPVQTTGGGNMLVRTPNNSRNSQGQMNLANPAWSNLTMNNEGVLQFTSEIIEDSLTIMGYPKAKIYAASNPDGASSGLTDTDFFVRILDVYPDGRELFVVEGAVNARAREYARSLADGAENINAPFSNINIGEVYEYEFELLPIAYTWGAGHQMKVLISSSNYNRYQVNANVPIEEGEFFRRQPNDGKTYNFNGVEMSPRIATQSIYFSPNEPTSISLPIFKGVDVAIGDTSVEDLAVRIYPNPASSHLQIEAEKSGAYHLTIRNLMGQILLQKDFENRVEVDLKGLAVGMYLVEVNGEDGKMVEKVVVR